MTAPVPATALLPARKTREYAASGIRSLDRIASGLPRGAISEFTGSRSSGRTSTTLTAIAAATGRLECCAWVDASSGFDPASAGRAGVDLERLVWVRCDGDANAALRSADLLLHGGGFGLVCLDLAGVDPRAMNRIPVSYWHRFRRAIEHTPTALVVVADNPCTASCAGLSVRFEKSGPRWTGRAPARLLTGLGCRAEVRKPGPVQQTTLEFWAA
jgi:RecA DNA recombination protein